MKLNSALAALLVLVALCGIAASAPFATAAPAGKTRRPNCKTLLPQGKIEQVMGGAITLEEFGKSDFIRNALTPGTEQGTQCVYGTTEATENAYGTAGRVSAAFGETPKQWNGYRASAKKDPGLEAATFAPVKLGGGNQAFVLHQVLGGGEPDLFYLYVYTPKGNIFTIDFLDGVTLKDEEAMAREIAPRLDAESPAG